MWLIPQKDTSTPEERWTWFLDRITPQTKKALLAEAYRILGSREDAQDILQEALLRGADRCWQLRREERLFQWMYSIVQNLSYDMRKQKLKAKRSALHLASRHPHEAVSLEDRAMSWEFREELERLLNALPSPEKEIVLLKCQTDMNLREIAKHLSLNYHTVRSTYNRTMKKILKQMR